MSARPRPRDLGLIIGRLPPGPHDAITDVPGVRAGHVSVVSGRGALVPGKGPARTGVTVVLPHPRNLYREKVAAAVAVFNGFTKAAGLIQVQELHQVETPVYLTNTLNVGLVADAAVEAAIHESPEIGIDAPTVNPVVLECNDGYLNDIQGRHVRAPHVFEAIEHAAPGPVAEGAVGAGAGMAGFGFKGGIGTASRRLTVEGTEAVWGVLALVNFGRRADLLIDGVPVGQALADRAGERPVDQAPPAPPAGSVVLVAATDAPVDEVALERATRRCAIGLARTGWMGQHGSGDLALALATGEMRQSLRPDELNLLFRVAAEAAEEAVLNALFAAETTEGRDGHVLEALPVERVLDLLRRHGRLVPR